MTPKEKADQLVGRYRKEILRGKYRIDGFVIEELAEECALVAVDEILPIVNSYENALSASQQSDYLEYWIEVKQEIEKL